MIYQPEESPCPSATPIPSSRRTPIQIQQGKGLRSDSVGLLAVVALGLASVAPAYSIAVTLGFVVMVVGHLAPAALLDRIRTDSVDGLRLS